MIDEMIAATEVTEHATSIEFTQLNRWNQKPEIGSALIPWRPIIAVFLPKMKIIQRSLIH